MHQRRDPFAEMADMRRRINRILEQSLRHHTAPAEEAEPRTWAPQVDIWETADSLMFAAELPGMSRQDIHIEVEDDRLTISGERKPPEGREYMRVERSYGPFHRSFAIGVPIDCDAATAKYRDGVLEITLPRAKHFGPGRVKVPVE